MKKRSKVNGKKKVDKENINQESTETSGIPSGKRIKKLDKSLQDRPQNQNNNTNTQQKGYMPRKNSNESGWIARFTSEASQTHRFSKSALQHS